MNVAQESPPNTWPLPKHSGVGQSFGTFGELLQGRLDGENSDFLVTFPIACFATAHFVSDPHRQSVAVTPAHCVKSQRLATMLLAHYDLPAGGTLTLSSDLPVGKGFASSSADLVATARAIGSCFQLTIALNVLQMLLAQIEPTDGVMYPGCVAFYHRQVRLHSFLGPLPRLTVVGIDEGGTVDTVQFNQRPKPFTSQDEQCYQHLLNLAAHAIRSQDAALLGKVATASALLNQKLHPKRMLSRVLAIAKEVGGLGVIVAHSGTCLGILLSPKDHDYEQRLHLTRRYLSQLSTQIIVYESFYASVTKKEMSDATPEHY